MAVILVTVMIAILTFVLLPHTLLLLVGGAGCYALGRSHTKHHRLDRSTRKFLNS